MDFPSYYAKALKAPLLRPEEEKTLIERVHDGDMKARERLVQSHLRTVVKLASPFATSNQYEDLLQVGHMALVRAVDHYNPSQDTGLNTYAWHAVRHALIGYLQREGPGWMLPTPFHLRKRLMTLMEESRLKAGMSSTLQELSAQLKEEGFKKCSPRELDRLLQVAPPRSLDQPLQDGESSLHDFLPSFDPAQDPERALLQSDLRSTLQEALRTTPNLTSQERFILEKRYLSGGEDIMTLDEVGQACRGVTKKRKVTREGIRKGERTGLQKLRRRFAAQHVRFEDLLVE